MSSVPEDLKYAPSHEWASLDTDDVITVGITEHAQDALGDVVFVELPEVGQQLSAGEEAGAVESVKAASEIYAPVSGEVVAINEQLEDTPETVNSSPYGDGWFFKIRPDDIKELDDLLDSDEYLASLADSDQ